MNTRQKTTEFLKECLADSLISLMKEKPLEDITITEITSHSGVSRSTWFRNFHTKDEVLSFKLVVLWDRYCEARNRNKNIQIYLATVIDFFQFNLENRSLVELLYKQNLKNVIYDAFWIVMEQQYERSLFEVYQLRFYAHGVFGLLEEWLTRGCKESPEEMVDLFCRILEERAAISN